MLPNNSFMFFVLTLFHSYTPNSTLFNLPTPQFLPLLSTNNLVSNSQRNYKLPDRKTLNFLTFFIIFSSFYSANICWEPNYVLSTFLSLQVNSSYKELMFCLRKIKREIRREGERGREREKRRKIKKEKNGEKSEKGHTENIWWWIIMLFQRRWSGRLLLC